MQIFSSLSGLERDLEYCDHLKLSIFGHPDQLLNRGHGHGLSKSVERLVRTGRGFHEENIEAWANLYTEIAMAIAAKRDGCTLPAGWLRVPRVQEGAEGVRFIHAALSSHQAGGEWLNF